MRDPFEAQNWHLLGAGYAAEGRDLDREYFESYALANRAKDQCKLLSLSVDAPYCTTANPFGRGYALASM